MRFAPTGSTLDEKNDTGMGALISAANGGVPDVVELLLQHISQDTSEGGDEIESTDEGGYTPLLLAAQRGHLDVVRLLAQYGAEVQALTSLHQNNAITLANEYPEVQQYLTRIWKWRPLQIAVENNDFKRTYALVQAGVDSVRGYVGPGPLEIIQTKYDDYRSDPLAHLNGEGAAVPPVDVKLITLLKHARQAWAPSRHMLFPAEARELIRFAMMMIPRVTRNEQLPPLPSEMWLHILSFLAQKTPVKSQADGLQRGWVKSTLALMAPKKIPAEPTTPDLSDLDFLSDDDDDMIDSEGRRARNSTSKLRCRALFPENSENRDVEMSEDEAHARDVGVVSFRDPQRSSTRGSTSWVA